MGLSFAANIESVRMEDPKEQNSLLSVTKSNGEFYGITIFSSTPVYSIVYNTLTLKLIAYALYLCVCHCSK